MKPMECRRAEELFSDHREGTLDPVLRADVEVHLTACAECRALREALDEVMSAFQGFPALEPSADLADRAATAALVRPRALEGGAAPRVVYWRLPARIQTLAAALAFVTSAALVWSGRVAASGSLSADRLVERTVNAGAYMLERKDRLVEDLRLLRMVIGTAFDGRLDRMNDRVDDYRRILERRRSAEQEQPGSGRQRPEPKRSRGTKDEGSSERFSGHASAHSLNQDGPGLVTPGVTRGRHEALPERDAGRERSFYSRSET